MGFYWGECNPSFKYHTARADGAPGSGGAAMEGARRGRVTGARRGRALMLPTKRLPVSRRLEDHLVDPGSGAGADGAGAWMEKKRRTPDNGFTAACTAPPPQFPAPQEQRDQRFTGPGETHPQGTDVTLQGARPAHQHPPSCPGTLGALRKQTPGGLDIAVSANTARLPATPVSGDKESPGSGEDAGCPWAAAGQPAAPAASGQPTRQSLQPTRLL